LPCGSVCLVSTWRINCIICDRIVVQFVVGTRHATETTLCEYNLFRALNRRRNLVQVDGESGGGGSTLLVLWQPLLIQFQTPMGRLSPHVNVNVDLYSAYENL